MGRGWYWTGRFSKRAGGTSAGGGQGVDSREVSTSSLGCMSAVLHFFNFQQLHFPVQHPQPFFRSSSHTPQDHKTTVVPKGAEAPRNSLESDDGIAKVSSITTEEDNLKFPAGIQIKTSLSTKSRAGILNDDTSSSPGTKTPTLVARLMGLDLLPDAQSPASSSPPSTPSLHGKSHLRSHPMRPRQHVLTKHRISTDSDISSCRSLPETPRISVARRSDVDRRLSLQINEENNAEEFELSRLSFSRKKVEDHSCRSSSHYARQVVKQVKESVGRRVGLDITNTVKNREQRRDELLLSQLKSKKISNGETSAVLPDECSPGKQSTCSPRLKFIETKNKIRSAPSPSLEIPKDQKPKTVKASGLSPKGFSTQLPQSIKVVATPKPLALHELQKQDQKKVQVPQCKKAGSEKFHSKLKKPQQTLDVIRNKQEEPFVRPMSAAKANMPDIKNKCKKSNPLSSNLLNLPTPVPVIRNPSPATKIIQKQSSASLQVSDTEECAKHRSQLSSCSSQAYKLEATQRALITHERERDDDRDRLNGAFITGADHGSAEFQYVCDILSRTGIRRGTKVFFNNWFSPSHPLDPSIFLCLEGCSSSTPTSNHGTTGHACNNPLDYRCNRKLLFDVVDEVLVEILKPCINMKPWMVNWSSTAKIHAHGYFYHCGSHQMQGSKLMEMLSAKIRSFPMADCPFLEDIDVLIQGDLSKLKEDVTAFEQEEGLVAEIEGDILDTLVHETICGTYKVPFVRTFETTSFGFK